MLSLFFVRGPFFAVLRSKQNFLKGEFLLYRVSYFKGIIYLK